MSLYFIGRWLIGLGLVIVVAGFFVLLASRLGLGRLPGDLLIQRGRTTLFFPLATSLLLSVILTILLNVIARWRR